MAESQIDVLPAHSAAWKWYVCGLLLLATMLNYMDRQTLSQVATDIRTDFQQRGLNLRDVDYGYLELGFGMAFAFGAVITGFLVDHLSIRWMYPMVLLGWSAAGFATSWADDFHSLFVCRVILGFFEAGQWPCALTTSQRILARQDRTLGNSILQSGAALGAIATPLVVQLMMGDESANWRGPFQVIGSLGVVWTIIWLAFIRRGDLAVPSGMEFADSPGTPDARAESRTTALFIQRLVVLAVVVVTINLCWHYFRAWLPKFLREFHHYERSVVNYFTMAYYLAADLGSLTIGLVTRWLIVRGWTVYAARLFLFSLCAALTGLSTVAAWLPAGWTLFGVLLVIGFGALGLFPNYYSFSQELTSRHQGKITGFLSCITWVVTALMHPLVGQRIDETKSYAGALFVVGLLPMIGVVALLFFWSGNRCQRCRAFCVSGGGMAEGGTK